jgi:imidazoleglycerol phosphate dehydratase HisB
MGRIKGRADDMVIIRGVNVYPTQVEAALLRLPELMPNYRIVVSRSGTLDEAAVEVALDLSGRAFVVHQVDVPAETIGTFDTGLVEDFVRAFAQAANLTVHVRLRAGRSPHHVVEAEFKALATALRDACEMTGSGGVPSTKGTL